jgi:hypothetical protein
MFEVFPPSLKIIKFVFRLFMTSFSFAVLKIDEIEDGMWPYGDDYAEKIPFKYSEVWNKTLIVKNLFLPAMLIEFPRKVCCDWK